MKTINLRDLAVFLLFSLYQTQACTTFAVGRKATLDGSVMATHSNDGSGTTDPRFVKVPAMDYPEGSVRSIYYSPEHYPRYVGTDRGVSAYFTENCQAGDKNCAAFKPIGFIPQVNHTYSYFEATYGIMNEFQVGIAESTCSGVFAALAKSHGGKALLSIDQLSQIALERSTTARAAVELIGSLAEEYGFYGESASFEGGSESLIITDPTEAWVFHILADPTGTSAIWAAARVPDDSVAVVANMFSIREIDLDDSANFLGRKDLWDLAKEYGLYTEGDPKDFTKTFSDGEYAHKYYSGRRMWGVFNLLAKSQNLPAEYGNLKNDVPYPFAVPVDYLVSPRDMMKVMRYWYNGTVYSTSDGLASGPFNTPDRYSASYDYIGSGSWERTIALYRSSDSYVVQSRASVDNSIGGVIWFGPAAAHSTNFVPILSSNTRAPDCLTWGWQGVYNSSSSFWAHRNILNFMQVKFNYMMKDLSVLQSQMELQSQSLVDSFTGALSSATTEEKDQLMMNNACQSVPVFVDFLQFLYFTYADGNYNYWKDGSFHADSIGYPAWWLQEVGYADGPEPVRNTWQKNYLEKLKQTEKESDLHQSKEKFPMHFKEFREMIHNRNH
jgi:dipeptidase